MRQLFKTGLPVFSLGMVFLLCACGGQKGGYARMSGYGEMESAAQAYDVSAPAAAEAPAGLVGKGFNSAAAVMSNLYGAEAETPGEAAPAQPVSPPAEKNDLQSRKLIKTAELRVRAEDPAATEKPLAELMEKYGAWPASSSVYENSRFYTIRVPAPSYDAMLSDLAGIGKMLRRAENAEDVTLHYYDLESRLATKRELLKTYQSYLGKANNIEEIMTVESKIADLQQEIDSTGTQFRNLANLIDYSTINLEIAGPASAASYSEPTLGEKLKELFSSFGGTASTAFTVLTGIIIYGVPAVLIAILLFYVLFGRIGFLRKLWRLAAGKKIDSGGGKRKRKEKNFPWDTPPAETKAE